MDFQEEKTEEKEDDDEETKEDADDEKDGEDDVDAEIAGLQVYICILYKKDVLLTPFIAQEWLY